jgi:hypothetical protein
MGLRAMTARCRYAPVENEIREKMSIVIECLRPYAQSHGSFVDWNDLREALRAAEHALERAALLANHKLPPTR